MGDIRVVLQQIALPRYRLPVFQELSRRPGIKLKLIYAQTPGIPNVEPAGLDATLVPVWQRRIAGQIVYWHRAQWDYATRRHADVLILSWNVRFASLVPALTRAHIEGVPTVLWGHGYSKHEAGWRAWPRRKVAQMATALLFYNHTTARRFIEAGWDPKRIYVALNALDQRPIQAARAHWSARPDELAAFRRAQRLDGRPVVLFVSRLEADNRVGLLLEAAAMMRWAGRPITVAIVGKGPDEQPLRNLAARLGLSDDVRFVGAVYDEMALAPWFLSADVFCYPANIGLSILHAFGYGVPVITCDRIESQNPEIEALEPGVNGLLYRDGDVGALSEALARIIDDRPLRMSMSESATRTVLERFTLGNMVDGMEAAVRYAAGSR